MALSEIQREQLREFFDATDFEHHGWVVTDLDGTVIHEFEGRYAIPPDVEQGLLHIYRLGRPVVLNTLRFPLSVLRTFGKEWYALSNGPVPTILMNGSQLGYMTRTEHGDFSYEEITAFPLFEDEIREVLSLVEQLVKDRVDNLLVFYYPRDWTQGEIIWTPIDSRVEGVKEKYLSASRVYSAPASELAAQLYSKEICMIFLLVDIPQDKLMAYQHTKQSNFFTRKGVDKLSGTVRMAHYLHMDMTHALGAGDTQMDIFLQGVGMPVHVRERDLPFISARIPLKVSGAAELGEVLQTLCSLQQSSTS